MSKKKKQTAYLAGPMEYAKKNGRGWRIRYKQELEKIGINCIIPEFHERDITNEKEMKRLKLENINLYIEKMRQLIALDIEFVQSVDMVIVKWNGEVMSGTIGEVQEAYLQFVPAYLVTEYDLSTVPGWFLACFERTFRNFKQLKQYLKSLQ